MTRIGCCSLLLVSLWGCCFSSTLSAAGIPQIVYLDRSQFVELAFRSDKKPRRAMIRIDRQLAKDLHQILGHGYRGSRIRYWRTDDRTAWVFDEIGKELPITIGIVVHRGKIALAKVLVYREERGGEIHQPFFTQQFHYLQLNDSGQLTAAIDGITGATLSVGAFTRVARTALYLDGRVAQQ